MGSPSQDERLREMVDKGAEAVSAEREMAMALNRQRGTKYLYSEPTDEAHAVLEAAGVPALLADNERLRGALERIGSRCCRVIYSGRPKGWTCLDQQRRAADSDERIVPKFRAALLRGDYLCDGCIARAALNPEQSMDPERKDDGG